MTYVLKVSLGFLRLGLCNFTGLRVRFCYFFAGSFVGAGCCVKSMFVCFFFKFDRSTTIRVSCFSLVAYSNLPWLDFKAFRFFFVGWFWLTFLQRGCRGYWRDAGIFRVRPGLQNSGIFAVSVALGVDVVRLDLIT